MRVRTIRPFYDLVEEVTRSVGDEFDATEERIAEINACGPMQNGVPLVEAIGKRRAKRKEQ